MLEENEEDIKKKIMEYNFINLKQIETYMKEFQNDFGKLNEEEYLVFLDKINFFTEKYNNYQYLGLQTLKIDDFLSFLAQTNDLMNIIKNKFREIWTEFNLKLMIMGVFIMIICFLIALILFDFLEYNIQSECRFLSNFLFTIQELTKFFKLSLISFLVFCIFSWVYEIEFLEIFAFFTLILCMNFLYFCYTNTRNLRQEIIKKEKEGKIIQSVFEQNLIATIIFWFLQISHGYMLFAVSHIRNEGQAIFFVLIVVNLVYVIMILIKKDLPNKISNIKNIILVTLLLYFAIFYENNVLNRNDITLKKVKI